MLQAFSLIFNFFNIASPYGDMYKYFVCLYFIKFSREKLSFLYFDHLILYVLQFFDHFFLTLTINVWLFIYTFVLCSLRLLVILISNVAIPIKSFSITRHRKWLTRKSSRQQIVRGNGLLLLTDVTENKRVALKAIHVNSRCEGIQVVCEQRVDPNSVACQPKAANAAEKLDCPNALGSTGKVGAHANASSAAGI